MPPLNFNTTILVVLGKVSHIPKVITVLHKVKHMRPWIHSPHLLVQPPVNDFYWQGATLELL
jgi:hypothetical protein